MFRAAFRSLIPGAMSLLHRLTGDTPTPHRLLLCAPRRHKHVEQIVRSGCPSGSGSGGNQWTSFSRTARLDIHKKTVVACLLTQDAQGKTGRETRTFSTMTVDILELLDWLTAQGCTHVAMESTGEYWKPVYNLLEDHFTLLVVNARHIKTVPRPIADLLQHGLLRPSFIPPAGQRALRDLARYRGGLLDAAASP